MFSGESRGVETQGIVVGDVVAGSAVNNQVGDDLAVAPCPRSAPRLSEALALEMSDFDAETGAIEIRHGGGILSRIHTMSVG